MKYLNCLRVVALTLTVSMGNPILTVNARCKPMGQQRVCVREVVYTSPYYRKVCEQWGYRTFYPDNCPFPTPPPVPDRNQTPPRPLPCVERSDSDESVPHPCQNLTGAKQ